MMTPSLPARDRLRGPAIAGLLLSAVTILSTAGCANKKPDLFTFVPLAHRYVAAFNHHWSLVCADGPRHIVRGFSGPAGCPSRMHRVFGKKRMAYEGVDVAEVEGTVTTPAPEPYRTFEVTIGVDRRTLVVTTEAGRDAIFLYDDCAATTSKPPRKHIGGCPA